MRGSFTVKINNYAKKEDYVFDLIQKIGRYILYGVVSWCDDRF